MELQELLPDFRSESLMWVEFMNASLQHLERVPGCSIAIENVFHGTGTLKRSAGLFGLDHVVDMVRAMENALERMSSGDMSFDHASITLLLSCCDHIRALIERTDPDWVCATCWEESEAEERALLGQLLERPPYHLVNRPIIWRTGRDPASH